MGAFAYHAVVNAMEARSGWTAASRFATAIAHSINGHLPYSRYHQAGKERKRQGARESTIERDVLDWLAIDLNPLVQAVQSSRSVGVVLEGYNAYNASAQLGVSTQLRSASPSRSSGELVVPDRKLVMTEEDPELCRHGSVVVLNYLLDSVRENERRGQSRPVSSVSRIAAFLGVHHSAAAEVATVFELEGGMPVPELARKLGCHHRTLERRLREEGLTAEMLRQACRLLKAASRFQSLDSLTSIAVEEGFADQAHMIRSFRFACGVTPTLMRKVMRGGLAVSAS